MDAVYWRTRCEAAERALQRARAGLPKTGSRKVVLQALADLKPSEVLDTRQLGKLLGSSRSLNGVHKLLTVMESQGLVERVPGARGYGGHLCGWKLAYLVQVEPVREAVE